MNFPGSLVSQTLVKGKEDPGYKDGNRTEGRMVGERRGTGEKHKSRQNRSLAFICKITISNEKEKCSLIPQTVCILCVKFISSITRLTFQSCYGALNRNDARKGRFVTHQTKEITIVLTARDQN